MRRRAFSLIELMIALAIIGILVTIAIPRFIGYRMRASQSEAKVNLQSIKQSETVFYAESNSYTDDLSLLVWRPEGSPRYLYGFATDAQPAASGTNDSAELVASGKGAFATHNMIGIGGVPLTDTDLPAGTGATGTSFVAGATANLDGDPSLDQMTINERAVLFFFNLDAQD